MAIGEIVESLCKSAVWPLTNLANLDLGIEFRVPEIFNRVFAAVSAKSCLLSKNIVIAGFAALLLNFTVANCVLVEKPLNEAVVVGSGPVKFKCKSDHNYRLKCFTQQSPSRQILFNGYSISKEAESFCNVENGEPGMFYLNLESKRESAQTYICQEPATNEESSADLIIIEREAQCKIDANNSHVILTCDLEFRGNWPPELEWSCNGTLITEGANVSIISNKSVSSTLTVPVSSIDRNYTCTTRFDIGGKPHWTTSDNIPDYVSSSVLTVKANQAIADKSEAQLPASGTSVGVVIGIIIIALAITVFAGIIIFNFLRKRKGRRNKDAAVVRGLIAA